MPPRPSFRAARPGPLGTALLALALPLGSSPLPPTPAHAQDPTVDDLVDLPEEEHRRWQGTIELGATATQGNAETTSFSAGTGVVHRREQHRWTLSGSALRATTEGEETANRGSAGIQYDFFPRERVFLFTRGRAGYNRPAGISRRLQTGAGGGWDLVETDRLTFSAEAGSTIISERFQDGTTSDDLRALFGQRATVALAEDVRLTQSLEVQPLFDDFGELLAEGELVLSTRLVGALGLRLSVGAEYDSSPFVDEEGIERERLDLTFLTSLSYEF